jgi:hypothetical protein
VQATFFELKSGEARREPTVGHSPILPSLTSDEINKATQPADHFLTADHQNRSGLMIIGELVEFCWGHDDRVSVYSIGVRARVSGLADEFGIEALHAPAYSARVNHWLIVVRPSPARRSLGGFAGGFNFFHPQPGRTTLAPQLVSERCRRVVSRFFARVFSNMIHRWRYAGSSVSDPCSFYF